MVTPASDDYRTTGRAEGILATSDIAQIHIGQKLSGDPGQFSEGEDVRRRSGVSPGGVVGAQMPYGRLRQSGQESGGFPKQIPVVVVSGDDESRDLEMCLFRGQGKEFLHRIQVSPPTAVE